MVKDSINNRDKIIVKISILGIIVNIVLVTFKAVVGLFANSIAIILDAVNNLTDALSSVITIVGTKISKKAPDKKHPYGHGRAEYFASVIISTIILFAGFTSAKESIEKVINPVKPDYRIISLLIITVAVIVKFVFGKYVKSKGKEVNSQSLIASGQDAYMDSILSFTTLISGILNYVWKVNIEGYLGILISLFIIRSAIKMLSETVDSLLGVRADSSLTTKLKETIASFDEVQGVYDLSLHDYGPSKTLASVHIQVRNNMTAEEIHILTREIEYLVYSEFGINLTMGIYAANDKGEFGEIKEALNDIIKQYKSILQLHGFYVDKMKNNVYFDLIIDFEEENKEKILNEVLEQIKEKYKEYNFNVILDSDITD